MLGETFSAGGGGSGVKVADGAATAGLGDCTGGIDPGIPMQPEEGEGATCFDGLGGGGDVASGGGAKCSCCLGEGGGRGAVEYLCSGGGGGGGIEYWCRVGGGGEYWSFVGGGGGG